MKKNKFFKVNDIRPAKLALKQKKFVATDINFLNKKKKFFVTIKCPACKKQNFKFFLIKNKFKYEICINCRTFFMNPRPSSEILSEFYKKSLNYKFWHEYIFPQTENARSQKVFSPRVKKIINICKKNKIEQPSIIDIGAGYGTFCKLGLCINFFKKVVALEPSREGADNCRKNKIEVIENMIEKINKPKKKFDIVTSFEVIEHLFSLDQYIAQIRKLTKKNGLIIFTCPNGEGFDVRMLLKNSNTIDHEHLNYFNPYSIKILLERLKLRVIQIFTPGQLDVDIVKSFKDRKKSSKLDNFFFDTIFDKKNKNLSDNFQKFLIDNKLSSNMWVVAKLI